MRRLWLPCLLLASLLPLPAEDWTTEDGKTYKNVTVVGQEDDGVRITYDGGVGKIPYYELPVDIQKRFSQDIDSLAAKRHAVDQAIDDAVKAAAAAQIMKQAPANAAAANSGPAGSNGVGGTSGPGGTGGTANAAAGAGNAAGGTAAGSNPAHAAGANAATAAAGSPGAKPGATGPGAAHAGGGGAGASEGLPDLAEPIVHNVAPSGLTGAGGRPLDLSVSKYTYNDSLDVCYLDSPAVDVYLLGAKAPAAPGQGSSLVLRIVTEGRQPQVPDRFEATFLTVGGTGQDLGTRTLFFIIDGVQNDVDDAAKKDSGTLSGGGQAVQYVSFYLTPAQARALGQGKEAIIAAGGQQYRFTPAGLAVLHQYLADVEGLAPASSSVVRSFYKWLGRLPSFFTIISMICEYVILGSFTLLVAASIAAFVLGITRFIKM